MILIGGECDDINHPENETIIKKPKVQGQGRSGEMREIQKKKIVKEYWDCGIAEHRHKTKEIALNCIEKRRKSRLESINISKYRTLFRNATIFERLVVNGESRQTLSKEYGLTESSISEVVRTFRSYGLVKRGITTRDEADRTISEWKQNKDEARQLAQKIKRYVEEKLKDYEAKA